MTSYIEPTAEQIAQAQAAGDAAYAEAQRNGASLPMCYDAYRAAYEAVRDEQDEELRLGYIAKPHMTLPEAQAVADAKMAKYATWSENTKDWKYIKGDLAL